MSNILKTNKLMKTTKRWCSLPKMSKKLTKQNTNIQYPVNDPDVIKIILTVLLNLQNNYTVENSEWDNSTPSDILLKPKSLSSDLPQIIIEIQHTIDNLFIKRVINYSLQAFKRRKLDPILLIICAITLSEYVAKDLTISNFPGCYEFPAKVWANNCLILCKTRVQKHIGTVPINPFITLGLFLTSRALDINDTLCRNDPIVQYLHSLALQKYKSQFNDQRISDTLTQLLETQDQEYKKILELIDKKLSPKQVVKAIKDLQNQNYALKRKYNNTIREASSSISTSISTATAKTNPTIIENVDFTVESIIPYECSMKFVENYMEIRKQKRFKRMNWLACYSKGIELNLFRYKSADVLHNKYNKHIKQKNN